MSSKFNIIRDNTPASAIRRGAVVAMGNFDGVHLGHRAVIGAALRMGRAHGRPAFNVTLYALRKDYADDPEDETFQALNHAFLFVSYNMAAFKEYVRREAEKAGE